MEMKGRGSDLELEKIKGQVTIAGTYSGTITLRELSRPVRQNSTVTVQKGERPNHYGSRKLFG